MNNNINAGRCLRALFTLLLLSQSCTDRIPAVLEDRVLSLYPLSFNMSTSQVVFNSYEKDSKTVNISAENIDWAFTDIPAWVKVEPESGNGNGVVTIQVDENTIASDRVGILLFGSANSTLNYSKAFTVSQKRAPYYIEVENELLEIDGGEGTSIVKVNSNTDNWIIKVPSVMTWCTARKTDGGFALTVTENPRNTSRSGVIELYTDDVSEFVTVIQRAAGVVSTTDRVVFPVEGGLKNISVLVDVAWSIGNNYSWLDVKTMSGSSGVVNIPLEATPNMSSTPRDGFIYIVLSNNHKIEIPIHQDGIIMSVDRESIDVMAGGSTERLDIRTNLAWNFLISDSIRDWVSVEPISGKDSTVALVRILPNYSPEGRTGTLWLTSQVQNRRIGVDINQRGRLFGADSTALHFSKLAGSSSFNVRSDGMWLINTLYDWITVSPEFGTDNSLVTVSVTENKSDTTRIGYIKVVTAGQMESITVYQTGSYIDVSSKALDFTSKGGSTVLSLSTDGHWTASANEPWVTISPSEGEGNSDIQVEVGDNASSAGRDAEITIIRDGNLPFKVSVNQNARYLTVSADSIVFLSSGGTSEPVIIQTDGTFDIATETDWITVNKLTESQFTVTAAENSTYQVRNGTVTVRLNDLVNGTISHDIAVTQRAAQIAVTYEYVDLGLSVNWATFNVGATKPEEYGEYYTWGETETKASYDPTTCKWSYVVDSTLISTKYNTKSSYGTVDNKTVLDPEDDVAHVKWGDDWRMPTMSEYQELIDYCTWTWTTQDGVNGFRVTSNITGYTDRSIFLPAAGSMAETTNKDAGEFGFYCSASLDADEPYRVMGLYSTSSGFYTKGCFGRIAGFPVRPVCPSTNTPALSQAFVDFKFHYLSQDLLWGIDWDTELQYNWDESDSNYGPLGYSQPELLKATIYNLDSYTDERQYSFFKIFDPEGGRIILSAGSTYDMLFYNFGTEWISLNQSDDYKTYTATTRTSSHSYNPDESNIAYNQPDEFIGGLISNLEMSNDPSFYRKEYDSENNISYVYDVDMDLRPYSFIYLFQVVIQNNTDDKGDIIVGANGMTVTGLAQSVDLFTSMTSDSAIAITTDDIKPIQRHGDADILAARMITWGLPGIQPLNHAKAAKRAAPEYYKNNIDIGLRLRTGETYYKTLDITDQMHNKPVGGIITVYMDAAEITGGGNEITPSGSENGYDYVDLGLSVKWATCNVGATKPEEYGDYYAWGETETKTTYDWSTYKWCNGSETTLTKYNTNSSYGTVDKTTLDPEDDVAHVIWGGSWRMPTRAEQDELRSSCTWTWYSSDNTEFNGVAGYKVTSNKSGYTDRFIFLPAGGCRYDTYLSYVGLYGYFWSSSLFTVGPYHAWCLHFNSDDHYTGSNDRYVGLSVRPVCP